MSRKRPDPSVVVKTKYLLLGLGGTLALILGGCAIASRKPPLQAASSIDLARYMGPWRVIAVTDNKVEQNFADAVETYSTTDGRNIHVKFDWRDKSLSAPVQTHQFKGRVVDLQSHVKWKMKLLPLFQATYVILAVGDNYEWAVVGHPSRKFGWILARQKHLSEETLQHALSILRDNHYDTTKFRRVLQPE